MPLVASGSKEALSENIRREIDAGKSPEQAAAIAYSAQRKAKSKGDSDLVVILTKLLSSLKKLRNSRGW